LLMAKITVTSLAKNTVIVYSSALFKIQSRWRKLWILRIRPAMVAKIKLGYSLVACSPALQHNNVTLQRGTVYAQTEQKVQTSGVTF